MRGHNPSVFYKVELTPKYLPKQNVQIKDEWYEILEVRPAFFWEYKKTNITAAYEVDLKAEGLKGKANELLDIRLQIFGQCKLEIRIEGAGGPVIGGFGGAIRMADERTSPNLLQFLILGEDVGWIWAKVEPIITPTWLKLRAEGFVYIVKKLPAKPKEYSLPPFIAYGVKRGAE